MLLLSASNKESKSQPNPEEEAEVQRGKKWQEKGIRKEVIYCACFQEMNLVEKITYLNRHHMRRGGFFFESDW